MQNHPFLLGRVRLAQIPSWGPGTALAPMEPMAPAPQSAPAGFALAPAPAPVAQGSLTNSVYAGGAIIAIMAAIGALLA